MIKKHRFKIDKLIRDRVSDFMREKAIFVADCQMDREEYLIRLNDKLVEEAKEVISAKEIKDITEELADVLEVIKSIAAVNGITYQDIENTRSKKKLVKGGFEKGIYCEFIEIASDNKEINYCLNKPEEYPEIK